MGPCNELADQATGAGTERRAYCKLLSPRICARKQKARDVRTRDHQEQSDRAE